MALAIGKHLAPAFAFRPANLFSVYPLELLKQTTFFGRIHSFQSNSVYFTWEELMGRKVEDLLRMLIEQDDEKFRVGDPSSNAQTVGGLRLDYCASQHRPHCACQARKC